MQKLRRTFYGILIVAGLVSGAISGCKSSENTRSPGLLMAVASSNSDPSLFVRFNEVKVDHWARSEELFGVSDFDVFERFAERCLDDENLLRDDRSTSNVTLHIEVVVEPIPEDQYNLMIANDDDIFLIVPETRDDPVLLRTVKVAMRGRNWSSAAQAPLVTVDSSTLLRDKAINLIHVVHAIHAASRNAGRNLEAEYIWYKFSDSPVHQFDNFSLSQAQKEELSMRLARDLPEIDHFIDQFAAKENSLSPEDFVQILNLFLWASNQRL